MTQADVLARLEGYGDVMELLEERGMDSVQPGICTNPDCNYTTEVEPDCYNGFCENCGTHTVQSISALMGII